MAKIKLTKTAVESAQPQAKGRSAKPSCQTAGMGQ